MNVLSLFDGMSCGQIALERAGIKVDNYFASEIDAHAMKVAKHNYPNIKHIGSVTDLKINEHTPKIDLLIGGSPCQSFSFAGKRKGMATKCETEILTLDQYLELKKQNFEFEGQSYLFWEYMRILNAVKPKYFLLENVKMAKKWKDILSVAIGCEPIEINSNLLSAQNRKRLYWTNIPNVTQPEDLKIFLKDISQKDVDESFYLSDDVVKKIQEYNQRNIANGNGFEAKFRNEENAGKMDTLKVGDQGTSNLVCLVAKRTEFGKQIRKEYEAKEVTAMRKEINQLEPRDDGKTNCLTSVQKDNYVCVPIGRDYRSDEGFRFKNNGKTGTLAARARNDESCEQLVAQFPRIRKLTPIECERLQTVPDDYTAPAVKTQRYKMLGNGWTVDVIAHIFKGLK